MAFFLLEVASVRAAVFLLGVVALATLSSPCLAADEGSSVGPRLGFALGGVYGIAPSPQVQAIALNPILQVELGVKIDRHLSVYALGEAGTIIFTAQAAAYAVVEWAPIPRLFLGTGIGGDTIVGGGGDNSCASKCPDGAWAGFSIPLIAGFDVARLPRGALRLDLEAAGGVDSRTSAYGWHTGFTFGWVFD